MYMHKIEQTTTGAISVIRENSVKCGNLSRLIIGSCLSHNRSNIAAQTLPLRTFRYR